MWMLLTGTECFPNADGLWNVYAYRNGSYDLSCTSTYIPTTDPTFLPTTHAPVDTNTTSNGSAWWTWANVTSTMGTNTTSNGSAWWTWANVTTAMDADTPWGDSARASNNVHWNILVVLTMLSLT